MTITRVSIDKDTHSGLGIGIARLPLDPPLVMRSLGGLVVVAGANGSGKSRLLQLIEQLMLKQVPDESRRELSRQLRQTNVQIEKSEGLLARRKSQLDPNVTNLPVADSIEDLERNLRSLRSRANTLQNSLRAISSLEISSSTVPSVVRFVPSSPILQDPSRVVEHDAEARAKAMESLGSAKAELNAPAYARGILRAALRARDERRSTAATELTAQEASEARLLTQVRALLGDDFSMTLDDSLNLMIGGWRPYETALSEGQRILFQFACLLHAQVKNLPDSIVLMDEPENHLHPAVLNRVVDGILSALQDGQLWIATHSVPLIAHLAAKDPNCLWYADGGRFEHAGRKPEKVLEGLMGGPGGTENLHDFTLLPAKFAVLRFLSECLLPPGVVGADLRDPQTNQIATLLSRLRGDEQPKMLRLLDFGAGKARLLATLAAQGRDTSTWLDYFAFDPSLDNEDDRRRELASVYANGPIDRSYTDLDKLTATLDAGSFHAIVMCNVLHEVEPSAWHGLFGPSGVLTRLLADDGMLLVVEDYGIPTGERAHRFGFLLLDEPELSQLFALREADRHEKRYFFETPQEERYKGRLVAHAISRSCLARFSLQTQWLAIETLSKRMTRQIDDMLARPASAGAGSDGRAYARSAQLLANASLWLQHHPDQPSDKPKEKVTT